MAELQPYTFRFGNVVISKDEHSQLGVGSYGAVYKAKCDQLPCAAKILHPALFQTNDPGSQRILERFEQECGFLGSIRHPNIVQYLGMCRDPDSKLPVLLMELLDSSLTKFLDNSTLKLQYHITIDLCLDIALAISFLHSNGIIHRDLSGNNVLIIAGSRAKVTDFGMSKLVNVGAHLTHGGLTQCPGTEVYMPPEAIEDPPVYTSKLDCFSFGVLVVQMLTRVFPDPGARTSEVASPLSPTGYIKIPVIDTERRRHQIDLIEQEHPLLPLALECLNYKQEDRSSARQICEQVVALKEAHLYKESKQEKNQDSVKDRLIKELQLKVEQHANKLEENKQIFAEKDAALEQKTQVILAYNKSLKHGEEELRELHEMLNKKGSEIEILKSRLHKMAKEQQRVSSKSLPLATARNAPKLVWSRESAVPCPSSVMTLGSCAVDGEMVYFCVSFNVSTIFSYNASSKKWQLLSTHPYTSSTLFVADGVLSTVGGKTTALFDTNKILSLESNEGVQKWVEKFPSMPTKRCNTAVACFGRVLIVAGGQGGYDALKTVELLDMGAQSNRWHTASDLPSGLSLATATVCGDNLYVAGIADRTIGPESNRSIFTCCLNFLVQTSSPAKKLSFQKTEVPATAWQEVIGCPSISASCVSINGELVTFGGYNHSDGKYTRFIYTYEPDSKCWTLISKMPIARCSGIVAVLPANIVMVVGGYVSNDGNTTNQVDFASF